MFSVNLNMEEIYMKNYVIMIRIIRNKSTYVYIMDELSQSWISSRWPDAQC